MNLVILKYPPSASVIYFFPFQKSIHGISSLLLLHLLYTILMGILINLLVNGLAVYITAHVLPGVSIDSFLTAIVASVVLGLINTLIKPILLVLTLPVNILTLGLFTFVINALMVYLVATFVPGFHVNGFWAALSFSLVLSIVSWFLKQLSK